MLSLFGYLGTLIAGMLLGLLGGGGSILIVPILVYLFQIPATIATGYSLLIVGLVAAFGCYRYSQLGLVDYSSGILFALPALTAVYMTRAVVIPNLPDPIIYWPSTLVVSKDTFIMLVFSGVMFLAAQAMIHSKNPTVNTPQENIHDQKLQLSTAKFMKVIVQNFGIGCLTGFVGAGGGFLITPVLVLINKLPMKKAVATSLFVIAVNSLLGFVGDIQHNTAMDLWFLIRLVAMAAIGIALGTYLSRFIKGAQLKPLFGYFVLIMSLFIVIKQLFWL